MKKLATIVPLLFGVIAGLSGISPTTARTRAVNQTVTLGKNIILNSGAEVGLGSSTIKVVPVPNWTTTTGFTAITYAANEDLSKTTVGPVSRGANYFYGGPDNAASSATQTRSLAAISSSIRGGKVRFALSGWLGGYAGQNDGATLTATFLSASQLALKTVSLTGPTDAQRHTISELVLEQTRGAVPKKAVSVRVVLTMTRSLGLDNDGLADNLSLVLK